jgi:uridine phosphorylase
MRLHHLGDIETAATAAILTGDPDRVEALAAAVGPVTGTWSRRGYLVVEVTDEQGPVLIASTGIGGPSAAIVVEELGLLGVRVFVRVGTCGSMQASVRAGDIVLSSGAVRDDGTSHAYLPPEIPAVPTFGLAQALLEEAERRGVQLRVGVTHCKDAYYAEKPDGFPRAAQWRDRWVELKAASVLATEMEAAALFAVAAARSWSAAAMFVAVDDSLSDAALRTAVAMAARLAIAGARAFDPHGR